MLKFICSHCNKPFRVGGMTVDKLIYHKYTCPECHTSDHFPLQHFVCSNCGNSFYVKKTIQEYADSVIRCSLCGNEERPIVHQFTCRVCGETRLLSEERVNSSSRSFHCIKCGAHNSIVPTLMTRYIPNSSQSPEIPKIPIYSPNGEPSRNLEKSFQTASRTELPIEQELESSTKGIISSQEVRKTTINLERPSQKSNIETYPLKEDETEASENVPPISVIDASGSSTPPVRESPRIRRLRTDEKAVAQYLRNSKYVKIVKLNGNPPDYYVVEYRVRGVERVENDGADVIFRDVHQVEIRLEGSYPRSAPICRMLTPIFHPNIEPAMICIGDDWSAQMGLADLIVHIGQIITYQKYNVKSPLDGFAAQWAEINSENFPIDDCYLFPPEVNKVSSLLDE